MKISMKKGALLTLMTSMICTGFMFADQPTTTQTLRNDLRDTRIQKDHTRGETVRRVVRTRPAYRGYYRPWRGRGYNRYWGPGYRYAYGPRVVRYYEPYDDDVYDYYDEDYYPYDDFGPDYYYEPGSVVGSAAQTAANIIGSVLP